jgi:hypothetical protein
MLTWIYTVVVAVVVVLAVRRFARANPDAGAGGPTGVFRLHEARIWMALIVLAQLRSPFLPGVYGNTAILLLLAFLLPLNGLRPVRLGLIAAGVLVFSLVLPLPVGPASSTFDYIFGLIATVFAAGLAVAVALRRPVTGDLNTAG